jgi:hypothetical protein
MEALQPELLIPGHGPIIDCQPVFPALAKRLGAFRQLVLTAGQRSQLGCQFGCGGRFEVAGFPSNPHLIELASTPSPASADIETVRARVHALCV